jgi:hypothetical protein
MIERRLNMTALLAMGMGIVMTTVAVVIAGFVLETVILTIRRSLKPVAPATDTGKAVVIHLKTANNTTGMADLAEEAA